MKSVIRLIFCSSVFFSGAINNSFAQKTFQTIRGNKANYTIEVPSDYIAKEKIGANIDLKYVNAEGASIVTTVRTLPNGGLKSKESNYFNPIPASVHQSISVKTELLKVIEVIGEHNLFVSKFEEKKTDAIDLILRHFVAEYLTAENYLTKEKENETAADIVSRCQRKLDENNAEIIRLEGLLKNTVKGQEELSIYLKIFLNRNDIKIEIEKDKFVLKRGTHPATNLSEGEKLLLHLLIS